MNPLRTYLQTTPFYLLLCLFLLNGCGVSLLNLSQKTPQQLITDAKAYIHAKNYVDAKTDKVEGIGRMPLGSLGGYEWPEFAWRTDV